MVVNRPQRQWKDTWTAKLSAVQQRAPSLIASKMAKYPLASLDAHIPRIGVRLGLQTLSYLMNRRS